MKSFLKAAVIPLIALFLFILAMRNGYITGTADNNTGRFAVSAENYGTYEANGAVKYVYFFDETGKLVKRLDFHNQGGIEISGNSETVSVNKENGVYYFDYLGNEKPNNTGEPVTRIYSPVSEPFSIKKQMTLWGYEYLVAKHNGETREIHLDKTLYIGKIFNSVLGTVIFLFVAYGFKKAVLKPKGNSDERHTA